MLNLLLSIPKDIVRGGIVSFLDLCSLVRLDTSAISHEHRQSVLDHIISGAEIDETIEHSQEAVRWLLARGVDVRGMIFRANTQDVDLDSASSVFSKLCTISFYRCAKLSEKAVQDFFSKCNSLEALCINECTWLADDILHAVAKLHPHLFELTISVAPLITDEGAAHLASCCPDLGHFDLKDCAKLCGSFLQELGRCDVFALTLTECPEIREEPLLAFIAERGEDLCHLFVSNNVHITDKTLRALARFCPQLDELSVDGCQNIDDAGFIALIPVCQQLTYLSANICPFSAAALDVMSASMSPHMLHLSISDCDALRDQHIEKITARAPNIEVLHIGYCPRLTNQALIHVGGRLSCLEELKVPDCTLLDYAGFAAVAQGCPKLRLLDVAFCLKFSNKCLHEIVTNCTQLSELSVSDVKCMTAVSMNIIAKHCINLKDIFIGFTSVTEAAVTHLIVSCPKLTYIAWDCHASVGDALRELVTQRKITLGLMDEEEEDDE